MRRWGMTVTAITVCLASSGAVTADAAQLAGQQSAGQQSVESTVQRVTKGFESADRSTVRKDTPRQSSWNDGPVTVGAEDRSGDSVSRSFWSFDIGRLQGKKILSAELMTVEVSSGSCSERPVQVWRTTRITKQTSWRDQPGWLDRLDTRLSAQGYSAECPMGGLSFDVTSGVSAAVNRQRTNVFLGLRSGDESDPMSWKRFQAGSYLSVQYVTPPTPPADVVFSDPASDCGTAADPAHIADATPSLRMQLQNPDGGNAQLGVRFRVWDSLGDEVWSTSTSSTYTGGSLVAVTIPSGQLVDGSQYVFRARTLYWIGGKDYLSSAWSKDCGFTVDTTAPPAPTVTSSAFPRCDDPCPIGASSGSFEFDVEGSSDVVGYDYELDGNTGSLALATPGETGTLSVSVGSGIHLLRVWSVDRAGNPSPQVSYTFRT